MKTLYLKIIELLSEIPEIKYIDLNFGQLQEEKPPLIYPAVLINMDESVVDDVQDAFQIIAGNFDLTICMKMLGETHSLAPAETRAKALEYLDITEKIYKKLQGYQDSHFDAFSRKTAKDQNIRKGLKTTVQRFETSWREIASS